VQVSRNHCAQIALQFNDFLTMQCPSDVKACLDILSVFSDFVFSKGNMIPQFMRNMDKRRASNSYYTKRYYVDS
jgi:hypothetical protein